MDGYEAGPRCQFNIVYFGRRIHIQINEKFAEELVNFKNTDERFKDFWNHFRIDLQDVSNHIECNIYEDDNSVISHAYGTITINFSVDEAERMSNCILNSASFNSQKRPDFPLNSFVAFGRKLRAVVDGEFTNKQRPMVREIIVERRVVR